jgi:hypothetical protein
MPGTIYATDKYIIVGTFHSSANTQFHVIDPKDGNTLISVLEDSGNDFEKFNSITGTDTHAYTICESGGVWYLHIVNMETPASPVRKGKIQLNGDFLDMSKTLVYSDDIEYAGEAFVLVLVEDSATGVKRLETIDINDEDTPVLASTIELPHSSSGTGNVTVGDIGLCYITGDTSVIAVNILDPRNPKIIQNITDDLGFVLEQGYPTTGNIKPRVLAGLDGTTIKTYELNSLDPKLYIGNTKYGHDGIEIKDNNGYTFNNLGEGDFIFNGVAPSYVALSPSLFVPSGGTQAVSGATHDFAHDDLPGHHLRLEIWSSSDNNTAVMPLTLPIGTRILNFTVHGEASTTISAGDQMLHMQLLRNNLLVSSGLAYASFGRTVEAEWTADNVPDIQTDSVLNTTHKDISFVDDFDVEVMENNSYEIRAIITSPGTAASKYWRIGGITLKILRKI